jgi:hypothetical protein
MKPVIHSETKKTKKKKHLLRYVPLKTDVFTKGNIVAQQSIETLTDTDELSFTRFSNITHYLMKTIKSLPYVGVLVFVPTNCS